MSIWSFTRLGAVTAVPKEKTGKAHTLYVAANKYYAGEAFPRAGNKRSREQAAEEEEHEPEEELADIEVERLRNIERNKAILKQLGLA